MTDIHEGGCVCGAVRYRVRGKPGVAMACHCEFCQKRSGSAFATFAYFEEKAIDPDWIRIERHIWVRSKRPWVSIPPDAAVFPQGSAGTPPPTASP